MVMTNTETQSYDILIAGGGMVGLPLAIALSDAGLRVALVDRAPLADQVLPAFDGRVSAVAYSSRRMLEALGVWEAMQPHAEPILDIRVVDGHSHSFLHYTHDEVGVERFGYIVENRVIRQALNARAATCENLHIIAPTRILKFDVVDARVTLQLENGARLEASLLIGADGKNSQIRQLAGISALEKSYRQTAIIATIAHANPHHGMAMERFFANGPFAVLPMQQNRSSLVWVEPEAMAAHYLALDDATFISEIQKRAGEYLGEITLAVGRFCASAWAAACASLYQPTPRANRRCGACHPPGRRAGGESRLAGRGGAGGADCRSETARAGYWG